MSHFIPLPIRSTLLLLFLLVATSCQQGGEQPAPLAVVTATPDESGDAAATLPPASDEGAAATPAPEAPDASGEEGYPGPEAASAYPGPESDSSGEAPPSPAPAEVVPTYALDAGGTLQLPASSADTATFGGTLMHLTNGEVTGPLTEAILYLGEVVYDDQGNRAAAGFLQSSPRATSDENGNFVFEDVPPGEYALFYWTPLGSVMLNDPETNEFMLFELEAGDMIDIGEKAYDLSY